MINETVRELGPNSTQRRLQLVVCQLRPEPRNVELNLDRLLGIIESAPAQSLIVTPELYLTGYVLSGLSGLALPLDATPLVTLREACARQQKSLVLGFAEEDAQGRHFNSMLVIDDRGSDLVCYRKSHLFPGEEAGFVQGDQLATFELHGVKLGLLNCYEIELPEPARALVDGGCEVLITSSANMMPYFRDHEVASISRALENRVNHVYVNQVGQGEELYFVGGSRWVRPDGTVGFEAEGNAESAVSLSFELRELRPGQADFLKSRRPNLY